MPGRVHETERKDPSPLAGIYPRPYSIRVILKTNGFFESEKEMCATPPLGFPRETICIIGEPANTSPSSSGVRTIDRIG